MKVLTPYRCQVYNGIMKKLTDRQREVLKLIYDGQKAGNTPTLFELAEALRVSSRQTVKDHLDAIAQKGWLKREPRRPRAIMLKPEAIRMLEKDEGFWGSIQQSLVLAFAQTSHAFQWSNPTNVVINQGIPSNDLDQTLIDSSSILPLSESGADGFEAYTRLQLVAEKSNFDRLQDTTSQILTTTYNHLVVSPIMPTISSDTGYLLVDGESPYQIIWSGLNTRHYYSCGKEYGATTSVSVVDSESGQMKLFSGIMSNAGLSALLYDFRKQLRSWSHYVDFPIYGAALKQDGEIIFWSRKTGRDINDLRYFFLVDITGTNLIGRDKVLLRDVSCNFINLSNNSTS